MVDVKYPWMKFFPSDWKKDSCLSKCQPATRGIWIDLICDMYDSSRSGKISGTLEQLARIARCTTAEIDLAIKELSNTKTADVTVHHENVTVINRRMYADAKKRESDRLRQNKHRRNADVTDLSRGICQKSDVRSQIEREKEREKPKRLRRCPTDFSITTELREWARTHAANINIEVETAAFMDHEFEKPKSDWEAAWRNWMRRSNNFNGNKQPPETPQPQYPRIIREDL